MFSRKADGPLAVQVPSPAEDHPQWRRVGVITAIGFLIGVLWPRLAGVRLGPSVPEATGSSAASEAPVVEPSSASSPAPASPPAASAVAPASAVVPAPAASATPTVSVAVGHGVVFACKTSDGDSIKGSECGSLPGLDGLVMPRLRKLADCPDAVSASGKVHFVVHLDFPRGAVGVELGRGHGVSSPDALLACAKTDIAKLSLVGVPHDNPRYSVAYTVAFAPAPATSPSASASGSAVRTGGEVEGTKSPNTGAGAGLREPARGEPAEGNAQVVWEVAIVRDAPKSGKVVGRLPRGAELHLGQPKDGWYPVKFGDGFAGDGWVYRGAIGR